MLHSYFSGSAWQRPSVWFLCWLLLAAPLVLAQPSVVKDIFPAPHPAVALNGKLYFAAFSAGTGMELYRSDLSGLNMQLVKDVTAGVNASGPVGLVNANGTLYFSVGSGLYKSDGTATGTVLVKTFAGGPPEWLTNVNGTLFFAASGGTSGVELWKSNGTAAGTVQVKDINPGDGSSAPKHLAALNGTVYFAANHEDNGEELWKSNGTAAGTVLVKDIYPGTVPGPEYPYDPILGNGSPRELTVYNGKVYFAATSPVYYGTELWRTDGTEAGTVLVKDLLVEPYVPNEPLSSVPRNFRVVDNKLVFIANATVEGVERVYASDGTDAGTVDIGGATPAKYYAPAIITSWAVANNVYSYATYSYASGVGPVVNFYGFNGSRNFSQEDDVVSDLTAVNGALYFVANDGMSGRELWVNNAGGIEKLPELNPGPEGTNPYGLFSIGNVLYFRSAYGTGANTLWKYDLNTPPPSDLRLNAGGPDHFIQAYEDYVGFYSTTFFRADAYFTGGTTSALPGEIGSTVIENAVDPKIYLSERAGTFSYAIPAPQGRYRVILHFAELYWGNTKAGGAGSRKFNVDLEGVRKLTEYDIFAKTGGALRAIRETFTVNVSDGTLNIAFLKGSADVPKVSAIEVIPVAPVNQAPVLAAIGEQLVTGGSILSFKATATDPDGNALTYSIHPAPNGNPFPAGATINPTTGAFTWTASALGFHSVIVRVTDNGNPAFLDEENVTICADPRNDFTVVGNTVCNVVDGSSDVTTTITIKNAEKGAYYNLGSPWPDWYFEPQQATGGDLVFTVTFPGTITSPATYTFKVYAYGCSLTREKTTQISLAPPLTAPTAAGKVISSGQTAALTASGGPAGATYRWYAAATGGTALFTGAIFTTPALTATTSYYVAAAYGSCESSRKQVTVTVTGGVAGTFRVNAGGNGFSTIDARSFAADAYFSGGTVSSTTARDIAGTADDYLYQTGRHGSSFSYNFPTGNGSYDVVLHFAETYFGNTGPGGIGSRKFHVNMEGARKLTDYDIFARAGGTLRVAQETFRVTVSDGTLNVAFLRGSADNPAIKAIEVLPAGSALAINSGGAAFTSSTGKKYSADVYYALGSASGIASGEIANTGDDALYRNARVGPAFSYGLPSGNGTFDVTLHFAETYWGSRAAGGAGSRRFNVDVEGVRRLTNYDVFAKAGGAMRAVKETIRVTVTDGVLNLFFAKGLADNPLVSAIEVTPAAVAAREATPEASAEDWQVRLFPNPVQDKLTVTLPFPAGQVRGTAVTDATGTVHLRNAHTPSGPNGLELRAADLPKGLYLLRLDTQNGLRVVKFVKQ